MFQHFIGFACIIFFIYNLSLLNFAAIVLENRRLPKYCQYISILFNTFLFIYFILYLKATPASFIFSMLIVYTVSCLFLFKASFFAVYMCVIPVILHYLLYGFILLASIAVSYDTTIHKVLIYDGVSEFIHVGACFLNIATINAMYKIFPAKVLQIIREPQKQVILMGLWFSLFTVFFFFLLILLTVTDSKYYTSLIILILTLVVFMGMYIVFMAALTANDLVFYKKQNKNLKTQSREERFIRNLMLIESIVNFEVNCTQNTIKVITDDENYSDFSDDDAYDEAIAKLAVQRIHPSQRDHFITFMGTRNLIEALQSGRHEISIEYRRLMNNNRYHWVCTTINITRDEISGDVRAFIYIKDIDNMKNYQLEVQHKAERDPLTELYNKEVTKTLISQQIDQKKIGSLFIVDIDNFKAINDNLGHAFGDNVIREVAGKIRLLFRESDVVGRIGGDEFMIFMKDIVDIGAIEKKANKISHEMSITYEEKYTISASIGIALFPKHADNYDTLYNNSDIALYSSKNKGKNTFTIYNGESFSGYKSTRTEIEKISTEDPTYKGCF